MLSSRLTVERLRNYQKHSTPVPDKCLLQTFPKTTFYFPLLLNYVNHRDVKKTPSTIYTPHFPHAFENGHTLGQKRVTSTSLPVADERLFHARRVPTLSP
ncbi:UNVERIFIED_CONTAM: hypothetical protein K2H54_057004 [Gekko kuhli]